MNLRSLFLLTVPCVLLLSTTAGCGSKPVDLPVSDPGDRLVATWQGTGQSEDAGQAPDANAVDAAMGLMQLTVEFCEDRTGTSELTLGVIPDPNPWNGPWQVVESDGDRLVVRYTKAVDGETVNGQMNVEFLDDDRISLKYPDNTDLPKFLLSRVSEN